MALQSLNTGTMVQTEKVYKASKLKNIYSL